MDFIKDNIVPGEVIVQLLAFLIMFFTLKALAWKPMQAALAARRERIKSEFSSIEHAKKEIESLKQQYSLHLQKIDDEARAKIQEAIDEGRRISREIQEKARLESQASFEKAKENLELEVAKARILLKREIADLTILITEKILKEKVKDTKSQQEKISQLIEELEKTA